MAEIKRGKNSLKLIIAFVVTVFILLFTMLFAANIGGIKVTPWQMIKGLFFEYDNDVAIIFNLRFPRIIVAVLGGMAMSVSGVLLQAVMRNPLADPGIIGIGSGSALVATVMAICFPVLSFLSPLFSFFGGMLAFILVYTLSAKGGLNSVKLILVGIAIDALFTGIASGLNQMTGNTYSGAASIVNANISLKTWDDVKILFAYVAIGAVLSVFVCKKCNTLALSDRLIGTIGVNVNSARLQVSVVAVLLSSSATSIIGSVAFLGLIVPHIARLIVGSDHKKLIPYSAILGAVFFLVADTVGRWMAYPYEIGADVIMSVIGGPLFIILLLRSKKYV